jgi:hypothetical protein
MLGDSNQRLMSALWLTHPDEAGVGQQAVMGGHGVQRLPDPRQEAAMDAQIVEQGSRFLKMLMRRGVGSTPGPGPNQNPFNRTSLGENCYNLSISRAEKLDDPLSGPNSFDDENWPDNPVKSVTQFETRKDDPAMGPTQVDDLICGSCESAPALIADRNLAKPLKDTQLWKAKRYLNNCPS